MNVAYKWYSHNNNILQFYSDHSVSHVVSNQRDDFDEKTIDSAYSNAANLLIIPDEIKILP